MSGAKPSVLAAALRGLLAELELRSAEVAAVQRQLADARARRADLATAIRRVLVLVEPGERAPLAADLARIEGAGLRPVLAADGQSAAARIVRAAIATAPQGRLASAGIRALLRAAGVEDADAAAHRILSRYAKSGLICRTARGRYRVVEGHPELAEIRHEAGPDPGLPA